MCGIFGQVGRFSPAEWSTFKSHAKAHLARRGPDGGGELVDPGIAFGHTRLKIIDLSDASAQPMWSASRRSLLTFNGEIYNYTELRDGLRPPIGGWRSTGDTEVLLELLEQRGLDGLDAVHGMFAFAWWQADTRRLWFVRDRLGKKPLFYARTRRGTLRFASEVAALLGDDEVDRVTDAALLAEYLQFGYIGAPRTAFRAVRCVEPGRAVGFQFEGDVPVDVGTRQYWTLPDRASLPPSEHDAWSNELRRLLHDSVRIRLRSDVPIGSFLSGGVDSSVVSLEASLALTSALRTFTVGFPDETSYSEAEYAREVAASIGATHRDLQLRKPEFEDVGLIVSTGELIGDPSMLGALAIARTAREHVVVALTGNGGDELVGGYGRYVLALGARRAHRPLRSAVARTALLKYPNWLGGDGRLAQWSGSVDETYRNIVSNYPGRTRISTLRDTVRFLDPVTDALLRHAARTPLQRMMAADVETYIPGDTMTVLDRASMAVGLELRSPLLDHRLFEHVAQARDEWLIDGVGQKAVLRHLYAARLPTAVFTRRKQGFSVPALPWLRGPQSARIQGALRDPARQMASIVDRGAVDRILRGLRLRLHGSAGRIWHLFVLSEWMERWSPRYDPRP